MAFNFCGVPPARPFQAFHYDEKPTLVFADVVNGADVGMIQRRCGAGFSLKSFSGLGILRQVLGKELQGYAPAKALVLRLVNHSHSAAAQLAYDSVMGNDLLKHVAPILGGEVNQVNFGVLNTSRRAVLSGNRLVEPPGRALGPMTHRLGCPCRGLIGVT
jgi:hypothetical protein